jgi:prepilin-type processing-associated H-X9-DG protein
MSGVAALLFLLSPLVSTTKSAARRAECQHRLRALADAFAKPDLTFRGKEFPDRVSTNPAVSWRFHVTTRDDMILPEFDLQQPWDGEINLGLARHAPRPLICPASYRPADRIGRFYTAFAAVSGPQTCFPDGRPITRNRISDGMSHTIVFGEAAGLQIVWTEPRDIDISALPIGVNLPGERSGHSFGTLSSYHPGGAIAAFADGRAQFISEHISPVVLRALLTADGGEPIPDTAY